MKKSYSKITFELLGLQLFFSLLSLIFVYFFVWLDNYIWLYSLLTAWLFLGAVHSTFWQMGRRDKKNTNIANNHLKEGQEPAYLSLYNGARVGSIYFLINLLVVLSAVVFDSSNVMHAVHRFMLGSVFGFIPNNSFYWPVCFLLCLVMYLPCVTAYISGVYNFSLTEKFFPKLIYKSSDKKQ